jgi:hypothetical protein
VKNVKNTEPNPLHIVHVKLALWIIMMMDLVLSVTTGVKLVLNIMIGSTEDTVLFVLMEEVTTHHNVIVVMVPLKLNKYVLHVN